LLLAYLPSVLAVDHWSDQRGETAVQEHAPVQPGGPDYDAAHASHCHAGPAGCSGQPTSTSDPVLDGLVELLPPDFPAVLLEERTAPLMEFLSSPPTEPPQL